MLEMIIETMFAIAKMMRLTGVEISNKPKCAKQTAISKSFQTLEISDTHCAHCLKWWFEQRLP